MIRYPLPPGITREQFHSFVTDLYYQLKGGGLDPVPNLIIQDDDEGLDDGTLVPHFAIIISDDAAQVLMKEGKTYSDRVSAKELIDETTLAARLTDAIRKHKGCERCTVLNVYKLLRRPTGARANWSIGTFISNNPDQQACQSALDSVKRSALEQFDLA